MTAAPDRLDWLRERRKGIGASDAAAIVGLSPYSSPFVVYLDKRGELPLDHKADDPGKRWGRYLEGAIADAFEEETGLRVTDRELEVAHPRHPWMRATLDGQVVDEEAGVLGVYEAKTTNGRDGAWRDGVPEYYALQVQHQLAVTGLHRAWVAVLIGGSDFQTHELARDEQVISLLIDMERSFWHDHVLAGVPPTVDGSTHTGDVLRALYRRPERPSVELEPSAAELARQYRETSAAAKEWDARAQQTKNALMVAMGDAEVGLVNGRPVVRWSEVTQSRLDQKALQQAHPDLCAQFTKVSSFRRLTVPGEK